MSDSNITGPSIQDTASIIQSNDTATIMGPQFATPAHICIASTICTVISLCGIGANGLVAFVFLKYRKLRNQFTILCVSQAGADIGVLLIYLLWAVPMTITQSNASAEFLGMKMGQISLMFWFAGLYNTLSIAMNRFLAIASPVKYKFWFSWKNTIIIIAICWILACVHEITYIFDGCDFYYDNSAFVWTYSASYCGQMIGWILDLGYGVLFFVLVFTLNICTFYKIRKANRLVIKQAPTGTAAGGTQKEANLDRRRDAEIRLFKLACIHSGIFELMLLSFHVFSRLTNNPWGTFVTTTLVWQAAHASNGYIYIAFNRDVRTTVKNLLWTVFAACHPIDRRNEQSQIATLVVAEATVAKTVNGKTEKNKLSDCGDAGHGITTIRV